MQLWLYQVQRDDRRAVRLGVDKIIRWNIRQIFLCPDLFSYALKVKNKFIIAFLIIKGVTVKQR